MTITTLSKTKSCPLQLTRICHGDLIDLVGIEPYFPLSNLQHASGEPLLQLEAHHLGALRNLGHREVKREEEGFSLRTWIRRMVPYRIQPLPCLCQYPEQAALNRPLFVARSEPLGWEGRAL
jgi:hypothetical protein